MFEVINVLDEQGEDKFKTCTENGVDSTTDRKIVSRYYFPLKVD